MVGGPYRQPARRALCCARDDPRSNRSQCATPCGQHNGCTVALCTVSPRRLRHFNLHGGCDTRIYTPWSGPRCRPVCRVAVPLGDRSYHRPCPCGAHHADRRPTRLPPLYRFALGCRGRLCGCSNGQRAVARRTGCCEPGRFGELILSEPMTGPRRLRHLCRDFHRPLSEKRPGADQGAVVDRDTIYSNFPQGRRWLLDPNSTQLRELRVRER